jgi:hypothetical protein
MTRGRMLMAGAIALSVSAGAWLLWTRDDKLAGPTGQAAQGDTTRAPQGQRIVVEVLNASGVTGLAKRATFLLRDRGFDVVAWTNDPKGRRSETLIVDYTNKPEAAERLARVLGGARIDRGKDSLDRGLDLSVMLGSTYRPIGESFHP